MERLGHSVNRLWWLCGFRFETAERETMMRASLALVLALGACSATSLAATKFPEQKAKLEQQLKAQFVPTTVNPDGTFGTPGTVLVLRKPDLGAVPGNAAAYYTNSLKDGRLTHPALANIVLKRRSEEHTSELQSQTNPV